MDSTVARGSEEEGKRIFSRPRGEDPGVQLLSAVATDGVWAPGIFGAAWRTAPNNSTPGGRRGPRAFGQLTAFSWVRPQHGCRWCARPAGGTATEDILPAGDKGWRFCPRLFSRSWDTPATTATWLLLSEHWSLVLNTFLPNHRAQISRLPAVPETPEGPLRVRDRPQLRRGDWKPASGAMICVLDTASAQRLAARSVTPLSPQQRPWEAVFLRRTRKHTLLPPDFRGQRALNPDSLLSTREVSCPSRPLRPHRKPCFPCSHAGAKAASLSLVALARGTLPGDPRRLQTVFWGPSWTATGSVQD